MQPRETIFDDNRQLLRCFRDLAALSTLSARWLDYDRQGIAESLADVLLAMLDLDLTYVCLKRQARAVPLKVARTKGGGNTEGWNDAGQAHSLGSLLAPWTDIQGFHPPTSIPNPVGSGTVRIVTTPLGLGAEHGILVAGSRRVDFATEPESLLLNAGANQAALLFGRLREKAAAQQAYAEIEARVQERTATLRREMAERHLIEREAQRAKYFALLGRMAAGVSHEICNPLSAIVLYVDLLEEELHEPSPNHASMLAALTEIKTHSARLDDLVQDYLSLVRVAHVKRTPLDVGAAVQAWAQEWQELIRSRGATLQLEGLTSLGQALVHESMLRRATLNLVQNALDAMPQGGTLRLVGRRMATQLQLQIQDTGSGIPPENLPKIFQPLYTTKPGGTGLGLYIVQEIIAAHGGRVSVESIGGQGTTFTLILPRAASVAPESRL